MPHLFPQNLCLESSIQIVFLWKQNNTWRTASTELLTAERFCFRVGAVQQGHEPYRALPDPGGYAFSDNTTVCAVSQSPRGIHSIWDQW